MKVTFYGSDFSLFSFEEYNKEEGKGVQFEGQDYDEILARFLLLYFLKKQQAAIKSGDRKIWVGRNEVRTKTEDLQLYEETKQGIRFTNLVGVISEERIKLREDDIDYYEKKYDADISWEKRNIYLDNEYDVQLQIRSRFDGEHTYFLPALMVNENIKLSEHMVSESLTDQFDFLLVYVFVEQFRKAYDFGPYRRYQKFEQNNSHIRGKIDIDRHIKKNMAQHNGKIACSYRENSVDNWMNHLVLYTIAHIRSRFPMLYEQLIDKDSKMTGIINELHYLTKSFGTVSLRKVMVKCENVISQPFYLSYEKLRGECQMLLRYMGVSMFDGQEEEKVQGTLFYIPDLWETFLERVMNRRLQDYLVKTQMDIPVCREITTDNNGKYKKHTFPDFVIFTKEDGDKPLCVLDAKFKPKWAKEIVLEDYTKCIRDMNSLNAHATGVIYPLEDGKSNISKIQIYEISEYNPLDRFFRIPILVPDDKGKTYKKWYNDFENNISEVVIDIIKLMDKMAIKR